jgi:autoinducer 2-degrading protein
MLAGVTFQQLRWIAVGDGSRPFTENMDCVWRSYTCKAHPLSARIVWVTHMPICVVEVEDQDVHVVIVSLRAQSGHVDLLRDAAVANASSSLALEAGCAQFDVVVASDDARVIALYEVYVDEAAFELHREFPHYAEWREAVGQHAMTNADVWHVGILANPSIC